MTLDQKEEILSNLKKIIKEEGSARVGFAISEVLHKGRKATLSDIEKISGALISTGEFERTRRGVEEEYYVFKNPQFELNQSLIATNESVKVLNSKILPENFKSQDRLGKRSLYLALISVIFIAISAFLQWKEQENSDLKDIRKEIKQSRLELDSISLQLRQLDATLGKLGNDTTFAKTRGE